MAPEKQAQETPEQLLASFENDLTSLWPHQRANLVSRAIPLLEAQGRHEEAQQAKWEAMLFSLHRRESVHKQTTEGTRFSPLWQDDNALAYYKKRLLESANPILRSWYGDFLWELKKDYLAAKTAIQALHDCYRIYTFNKQWEEAADSLTRALELAVRLNDFALIQEAKSRVLSALDDLSKRKSHPEIRYCLDLVHAIANLGKRATSEDLRKALSACQAGAAFYASEQGRHNFLLSREFSGLEATIQTKLGYSDAAKAARVRIGEYLEAEAEQKGEGSNLVAAHFLQDAVSHYASIGRSDKVEELKPKVRGRWKAAIERGEFKEVSSEIEIPVDKIKKWARELLQLGLDKALLGIGVAPALIPDIEEARKRTQQLKKDFPLVAFFPRSTIRGARQVNRAESREELDEANALNQYAIAAGLNGVFLDHTLEVFIEEAGLNSPLLVQHLGRSPFMEQDALDMVAVGVERYFAGDYVSAIHVLVPKLEETLRRIIGKLGVSTTSQVSDGFTREKPLDEVLKTPQLKDLLGERVLFYFEYMLNLQLGENLRNEVAHGLMTKDRCTKALTERIIHLYLMLTPFEARGGDTAASGNAEPS